MISRETFHGGARYINSSGTMQLHWGARLYRIMTADGGNVVLLPRDLGRGLGGPQLVIVNDSGLTLHVARFGEGGSPTWNIPAGHRAFFHLRSSATAAGDWIADIRQIGPSGVVPKLEGAVVGGIGTTTNVLRLQNATDTFIAGAASPNLRAESAAFSSGQELFVGGYVPTASSSAQKLDGYRNDTWRQIGSIPIAYGACFGGFAAGLGFLFAGLSEVRTHAFNPRNESWSTRRSLGLERSKGASASVKGKVYLIAGDPARSPSVAYAPLLDSFSVLPGYSGINRRRQSAFGLMGKVYACGGIDDVVGTHDLVDVLDVHTLSWSVGAPIPMGGRSGGAAFAANRRGYYGGGRDGAATDKFDVATLRAGTWVGIASWGSAKYGVENASGACQ